MLMLKTLVMMGTMMVNAEVKVMIVVDTITAISSIQIVYGIAYNCANLPRCMSNIAQRSVARR